MAKTRPTPQTQEKEQTKTVTRKKIPNWTWLLLVTTTILVVIVVAAITHKPAPGPTKPAKNAALVVQAEKWTVFTFDRTGKENVLPMDAEVRFDKNTITVTYKMRGGKVGIASGIRQPDGFYGTWKDCKQGDFFLKQIGPTEFKGWTRYDKKYDKRQIKYPLVIRKN